MYPMIMLADNEGPDQTARMRRLILAFAVRICPKKYVIAWRDPYSDSILGAWTHFQGVGGGIGCVWVGGGWGCGGAAATCFLSENG